MAVKNHITTTLTTKGPFFQADPSRTFRQNVRVMMAAVAAEGESDVKAQLKAGESQRYPLGGGIKPGRVSGHVVGLGPISKLSRTRREGGLAAVVFVNNTGFTKKQGTKLMAAASHLEGTVHAFRKTKNRIARSRKVNEAELLKGLQ